ncbi:MAG: hypothetical protein ACJAZ9_000094 [Neolewinella sp.]|jgi:hypothetical protein
MDSLILVANLIAVQFTYVDFGSTNIGNFTPFNTVALGARSCVFMRERGC